MFLTGHLASQNTSAGFVDVFGRIEGRHAAAEVDMPGPEGPYASSARHLARSCRVEFVSLRN